MSAHATRGRADLPSSTPAIDAATTRYLAAVRVRDAIRSKLQREEFSCGAWGNGNRYWPAFGRACALAHRALVALCDASDAAIRAGEIRTV